MGKLQRSWSIFRKSMAVIGTEKKLLIFPLISAAAMIFLIALIIGGFTALAILTPDTATAAASTPEESEGGLVELVVVFACYLITMVVANICNVAFFAEIFRGLRGEAVSISRGFSFAFSRFKAILLWSLLASTVGVILNMLQERAGIVGKIILKIIGVVWAVASCFAIPALVFDTELNNPFEALRRSAATIRRTWGESLIGFLGIQSITLVAFVLFILFSAGMLFLSVAGSGMFYLTLPLIAIALIALIVFAYLVGVAQQVYQAALYLYAQGEAIDCYDAQELEYAFKSK